MAARQAVQTAEDARLISLQKTGRRLPGRAASARAGARDGGTRSRARRRSRPPARPSSNGCTAETAQDRRRTRQSGSPRPRGWRRRRRRSRRERWPSSRRATRRRPKRRVRAGTKRRARPQRNRQARAKAARKRAIRSRKGRTPRPAAAAAQSDSRNTRDRAWADRQPVRRAVRHRQRDAEAGRAREARTSRRHPAVASGAEAADRGAYRQRRDADYNQRLSENRADSVRTYLVEQGIASSSVGTTGFGETMPVASNDTPAGRQQNRRVELIVSGESIGTSAPASPTTR